LSTTLVELVSWLVSNGIFNKQDLSCRRTQWSSGSMPDCSARGPEIELRCRQLCLLQFTALGTSCVHPSCSA